MKSGFSIPWAMKWFWIKVITINFQLLINIAYIIVLSIRAGAGRKGSQVVGIVIVSIIILIVIACDFYYTIVIRNFALTVPYVAPQIQNNFNPVQIHYEINLNEHNPYQVTYLQQNNLNQEYIPYQPGIQTGIPVQPNAENREQHKAYPVLPQAQRNSEVGSANSIDKNC